MSATKRKRLQLSDDSDKEDHQQSYIDDDEEGGIRVGDIYIPPPPKPVCSVEIGRPRLLIEKIVNRDFKSYAGTQSVGPFHKCFSSIMGPNGSGKSNVIDSLLFVFGYRASKIRSKKISVLIHNSENHQNIKSCSVSVHFKQIIDKDDENYEDIPNSEFVISRTAFKDNSSYYEINDKRVHFKEVAKLLKSHGVDLDHNRFLILQGEVEQISMMKPKAQNEHETGMLEYLEDIIGTARFKEPLQKLSQLIDQLTEDRTEKVQKAKMIEKEKSDMQAPYEEAIRFLKTENYLKQLQNVLWQKYMHDEEKQLKDIENDKEELKAKIKQINDTVNTISASRNEKEATLNEITNKKNKNKKRLEQLKETLKNANKKDEKLQEEMINANKKRKTCMNQVADEKKKLMDLEKVPEKNRSDIVEIEKKLERLNEEIKTLETQKSDALKSVANETRQFNAQLDELQPKLISLNRNVENSKAAFQLAESELNILTKNETDEKLKLERLSTSYNTTKSQLEEKQRLIDELKKEIPNTEKQQLLAQQELVRAQQAERKLTEQLDTLRAKLQDSRTNMQNSRSRGRVLDALTQLKNEGKMPGFLGRLGDLGAIDLKYDVAVSTACGPLDHLIVEDVQTANACIDFLKRHNIGRANFIALDKQEHLREQINIRFQSPENVPRLFDLIRCVDERVKTAFYFGLRNTLVANDLEQATRIAFGARRYRVVTLGGQLIETSGTMSGGGNTVSRGRMGQKVLVNTNQATNDSTNIQKLEDDVNQLMIEVETLRGQQVSCETKFNQLSSTLNQMKFNLKNYVFESQSLSKQLSDLKKQMEVQQKKVAVTKTDEQKVKAMKSLIETKKNAYEQAIQATTSIKEEVKKIETKITNITKEKTGRIQSNLSEKTKLVEKLKAESVKLEVGIKTSEKKAKASHEKIVELEQEIKNLEQLMLNIQEERKVIEEDANTLLNSIEEITDTIDNGGLENNGLKDEIAKLLEEENVLKTEVIDFENKLKNIQSTINKSKDKIYCWQKKLSDLVLHNIPVNEVEIERNETLLLEMDQTKSKNDISAMHSTHQQSVREPSQSETPQRLNKSQTKETLRKLTEEELTKVDSNELQFAITAEQEKLASKRPNLNIIEEYKKIQLQYIKRVEDVENVTRTRQEIRETFDRVKKQRDDEFLNGYQIINLKLKEMYQMITLGGDAELELVDSLDPFNEGVSFSVRPPKKTWKNISNLSGGEKTLSSLALVFALHYYKPSPLYVMDEIDAALDFKNVSIIGNYIKERTKNAQFIIISLRSNMFELANRYVGIYKTHNCTKSVTIDPQYYTNLPEQTVNEI